MDYNIILSSILSHYENLFLTTHYVDPIYHHFHDLILSKWKTTGSTRHHVHLRRVRLRYPECPRILQINLIKDALLSFWRQVFSILSPFFYMLTSYYSPRGSLVLFDNVKNRVVDQNHKRLFPATPARVDFLVSMGTLSPVEQAHTTCKGRA